jgi:hypothetical protein
MSNPTSNFNWQMPTATDLVTDLPADFEVFGQAVDTSLADLKGGTSGQILAKNTNADMDFVWITNDVGDITAVTAGTGISGGGTSGAVTITNSMATEITAKGDLIVGTGNAAFDNLPAGTNGHVLTADSTVSPTGLKWAALPSSTPTFVGARVTNATQQTIATATNSILTYTQETYDTDGFHDNSTNTSRFTIPAGKAGKYMINYIGLWSSADNTLARNVSLLKNGSNILLKTFGLNTRDDLGMSLTSVQNASVGDYFEIQVYQSSGINIDINKSSAYAEFSISYLGA